MSGDKEWEEAFRIGQQRAAEAAAEAARRKSEEDAQLARALVIARAIEEVVDRFLRSAETPEARRAIESLDPLLGNGWRISGVAKGFQTRDLKISSDGSFKCEIEHKVSHYLGNGAGWDSDFFHFTASRTRGQLWAHNQNETLGIKVVDRIREDVATFMAQHGIPLR